LLADKQTIGSAESLRSIASVGKLCAADNRFPAPMPAC
jgi:hypothetical protein